MKESGIVAERLKALRESVKLSQAKLAVKLELEQTAIFRYESKTSFPPYSALIRYADYFDVSLDYIFGRTDKPQGKLYDYNPKAFDDEKMQQFVEMCFDPKSPAIVFHAKQDLNPAIFRASKFFCLKTYKISLTE